MVLILRPCLFQLFLKRLSPRHLLLYQLVFGIQFRLILQALLLQKLDPAIFLENLLLHRRHFFVKFFVLLLLVHDRMGTFRVTALS